MRAHEQQLRDAGIEGLALFGSTARGDQRPDSDVDLLAIFDATRRLSVLDVVGLQLRIADLLGVKVDLTEEGSLKPRVQKRVQAEVVRAFLRIRYSVLKTSWTTSDGSKAMQKAWIVPPSWRITRVTMPSSDVWRESVKRPPNRRRAAVVYGGTGFGTAKDGCRAGGATIVFRRLNLARQCAQLRPGFRRKLRSAELDRGLARGLRRPRCRH